LPGHSGPLTLGGPRTGGLAVIVSVLQGLCKDGETRNNWEIVVVMMVMMMMMVVMVMVMVMLMMMMMCLDEHLN
jgi:heme/copper-type cytochrome/quinol oxidase subunit 2